VSIVNDDGVTSAAADGKQLVVISESVAAATVGATFKTTPVPVIVAEAFVSDDMGMVGTAAGEFGNTGSDQTQVTVTTAGSTHPLGAGLPAGTVTTASAAVSHGWGKPAASATVAATLPSDSSKATIFGYDTGAAMVSGTAPARRASWFHYSGNSTLLNDQATALFDATVTWTTGTAPKLRYTRDATDRITERKVNGRTVARYSYTGAGDTSDLTLDTSGNLQEATLSLPGGVIYTWRTATPVWSYPNLHGDLALTTDTAGVKVGPTRVWNPWGSPLTVTAEQDNSAGEMDYGWHGTAQRPLEHQTGAIPTIEMGARQYDPTLGRFLETDPIESGTSNDYTYVTDPINGSDLNGECGIFGNPFRSCKKAFASRIMRTITGKRAIPQAFLRWASRKGWTYKKRSDGHGGESLQRTNGDGCSVPFSGMKRQWDQRYGAACGAHDAAYDMMRWYNSRGFHVYGKQRADDWFAKEVETLCLASTPPNRGFCKDEGRAAGWATRAGGKPD